MFVLILVALVTSIFLYSYIVSTRTFNFWKQLGIANPTPIPFFGNIKDFVFGKKHLTFVYNDVYKSYDAEPYVGIYELNSPNLLIRDPELAHRILVQDFSYFHDRGIYTNEDLDPLSAHLVNLTGQRWKATRSKLMPAFCVAKLKQMYPLMRECAKELDLHLQHQISYTNEVEMSETMGKFATDVIGRCAFGLNCRSLSDPEAEFRKIGRKIFLFTYRIVLRMVLRSISPKLLTIIPVKMMPPDVENFFYKMLYDIVDERKFQSTSISTEQRRSDFLQLMLEIQEQEKNSNVDQGVPFTDTLFVANMFVFFAGGFETTSTALSCCIYELSLNVNVQNKLREEIQIAFQKPDDKSHDGYQKINRLKYLDMVILETLRKYVPISFIARMCTHDYLIPETGIVLKAGTRVTVPVYSYHMDPKYYPNPDQFYPERFKDGNRNSRVYLPFGDGPRICIGLRFAKLEMKCCLVSLLLKYSFSQCESTELPLDIEARSIFFTPKNGIVLRVSRLSRY